MSKNNFKISFDSNGPLTSKSEKKQSMERKASDDSPTLSAGPNISPNESGYSTLIEMEVVINCI